MINTITLYKYDTDTKLFVGKVETSNENLIDEPGFTNIPPPENPGGKIYKFEATKWKTLKSPGDSISLTRTNAKSQIDRIAENFRTSYITSGPIQTMVYDEKYNESVDYVAKNYPSDLTDFPYIKAEYTVTDVSGQEIADGILARRSKCMSINAKVEEYRLHSKISIKAATKKSETETIISGFRDLLASIKL